MVSGGVHRTKKTKPCRRIQISCNIYLHGGQVNAGRSQISSTIYKVDTLGTSLKIIKATVSPEISFWEHLGATWSIWGPILAPAGF